MRTRGIFNHYMQISLYIHWPFCKSKCPYCDFNSHVQSQVDMASWADAYIREIDNYRDYLSDKTIGTIFIGGGTPSTAAPEVFAKVIDHLATHYNLSSDIEITMEANPTSIEAQKFHGFRASGINRVSIGVQSLREERLKFLGREHDAKQAREAIEIARNIFPRVSFDLIYATPGQSLVSWEEELREALDLGLQHISLYQLTIEKGTPFFKAHRMGDFIMPDEDDSTLSYQLTNSVCAEYNLARYEVSNYAVAGQECRHNLAYWRYQDYLGIGPGAHGRITMGSKKFATMKLHSPNEWIKAVAERGIGLQSKIELSQEEVIQEQMVMGLRIPQGVCSSIIKDRQRLEILKSHGLLSEANGRVSATDRGLLLLNSVISYLQ